MMMIYMILLAACGLYDYRTKSAPIWLLALLCIVGIGMCVAHPFPSILFGFLTGVIVYFLRIGSADKIVFLSMAISFHIYGFIAVFITLLISKQHSNWSGRDVPALVYAAGVTILGYIFWRGFNVSVTF